MAKGRPRVVFTCSKCAAESLKWMGKCPECGEFNSYIEGIKTPEVPANVRQSSRLGGNGSTNITYANRPHSIATLEIEELQRIRVPISEFERVLGGGIVPGSLTLISGDPGIGKSTLLLQVAAVLATTVGKVLYVSAEESPGQIKIRAQRLGLAPEKLYLLGETNLNLILDHIEQMQPSLVVIDSIQTVYLSHKERGNSEDEINLGFGSGSWGDGIGGEISAAAGSVTQVRECAATLMRLAKRQGIPMFLVGHVTKDGNIAGPRVLEHMVDTVLHLEGDRFQYYRLLRSIKNRFGSTNEVGVFEMQGEGLVEVTNPSSAFLAERVKDAPGSAVAVTMEGTRPILVEVQALCSQNHTGMPRRTANGVDLNRLMLLTAVLSKRMGVQLGGQDVYVNVVGGIKITEPAADLSIAASIVSSFHDLQLDPNIALIGEVGLSGELRTVGHLERRLAEAAKLGFTKAAYPKNFGKPIVIPPGMQGLAASTVAEALDFALNGQQPAPKSRYKEGEGQNRGRPPARNTANKSEEGNEEGGNWWD